MISVVIFNNGDEAIEVNSKGGETIVIDPLTSYDYETESDDIVISAAVE